MEELNFIRIGLAPNYEQKYANNVLLLVVCCEASEYKSAENTQKEKGL